MAKEKIYYCVGCGKTHPKGDFYKSYNPKHKNGVYPFCKNYIKREVYKDNNKIDLKKFQSILMQIDAPFIYSEFEGAILGKREAVGGYFSRISLPQYRASTWKDSIFEDEISTNNNTKTKDTTIKVKDDDFTVTPEMLHRWGKNYTKDEIRDLEKFYTDMHMTHSIVTPQHEKALIMMCKMQLKMDRFLEDDNMTSFSKLHGEYQKLLQSSGLRPIDKVGGDEATGMRSFSQIFEEVEKDGFIKPAPLEENQDIVDRTIQYIMNYTLKLLNQQVLTEPPPDTPKVDQGDKND